jgi:hypothetical protein
MRRVRQMEKVGNGVALPLELHGPEMRGSVPAGVDEALVDLQAAEGQIRLEEHGPGYFGVRAFQSRDPEHESILPFGCHNGSAGESVSRTN